jgi:hypothetical protein
MYVEETLLGPVAGRYEEDEEQDGAVDAGAVQEIGQEEEREDKSTRSQIGAKGGLGGNVHWGCVGGDEEEWKPTPQAEHPGKSLWPGGDYLTLKMLVSYGGYKRL